jgi:hypothetical protein
MKRMILTSIVALALVFGLKAADIYSAQSGDFFDPATWTGGVVPGASDNVFISPGDSVGVHLTAATGSYVVSSLSFDNGSEFYTETDDIAYTFSVLNEVSLLAGNVTIDINTVMSSGDVLMVAGSGSTLKINPGYTYDAAGTLKFEAGITNVDVYGVLTVDSLYVSGNGTLNVFSGGEFTVDGGMYKTGNSNFTISNDGTATVLGDVSVNGSADLIIDGSLYVGGDFYFNNGTVDLNGELQVDGTLEMNNNVMTGDGIVSANPVSCDAGTGEDCADSFPPGITVLPVELISFKAYREHNEIEIVWSTASEEDNDFFTIERSGDAIHFNEIGCVQGAGNSNALIEYSFTDFYQANSPLYYRLKQTDYNGAFSYSEIITPAMVSVVQNNMDIQLKWSGEFFQLTFGKEQHDVNIQVYSVDGSVVSSWKLPVVRADAEVFLGASLSPNTFYIVEIVVQGSERIAHKIITE